MKRDQEFQVKLERIAEYCSANGLDGVALSRADNFAWLGCGADNVVNTATDGGVGTLVVLKGKVHLVTNNIECERLLKEELQGIPLAGVEAVNWWEPDQKPQAILTLGAAKVVAADDGVGGLPCLKPDFASLRYELTPAECQRFRNLGRDASEAMEDACFAVAAGVTEADIAAELGGRCLRRGIAPIVALVAVDERIRNWRHPIAKSKKLKNYAMIVLCGRRQGLVAALTRLVSVVELPKALKQKHQAVCYVDAVMMNATRPGRTAGDVFRAAREAYANQGFEGEWQFHHQGGAIGYQPREYVANPASAADVRCPQAFAWNPSIKGTKSEDTMLVTEKGIEILTAASDRLPTLGIQVGDRTIGRPGILTL